MNGLGSVKVVHDRSGRPWLVVGTSHGYEARRVEVVEVVEFDRSWQAVRHVTDVAS